MQAAMLQWQQRLSQRGGGGGEEVERIEGRLGGGGGGGGNKPTFGTKPPLELLLLRHATTSLHGMKSRCC